MTLDDLPPVYRAFVEDRLGRAGFDPATFPLTIAEDDEMFVRGMLPGYAGRHGAAFYRYVESAIRLFEVYGGLAAHLGGFERLSRVLDFGSGHGRLTRTLLQRMPRRKIWACDIYPNAVAWQAATFGVNALVSAPSPDLFALDERHEVVLAGSVFSHLPDALFRGWLGRLYELVAPGGLLAFSVHGAAFAPAGQAIGADGHGYAAWSESLTLDPQMYGMSYVTDDYVRDAVAGACGPAAAAGMRCFPRALFESQDLYVVPGADVDLAGLALTPSPLGSFRKRDGEGGGWAGWVLDTQPGARIVRASAHVGEAQVAELALTPGAEDVLRYFPGSPNAPLTWQVDEGMAAPGSVVRVEFLSSSGARGYCYAEWPRGDDGEAARS